MPTVSQFEGGFQLGELRIDPQAGDVTGPGGRETLDPKVMGVLVMLAERAGQVVGREELLARLWPGVVVTDDAISRCLYELRRQLAAAGGSDEFRAVIETLPKRGYRLNAEVTSAEAKPKPRSRMDSGRGMRRAGWAAAGVAAALAIALAAHFVMRDSRRASIAVLPFVDMSETQDQAYLADGVSEEIIDKLNQSTDLRVIARTSSFTFRGKDADVEEIANKLDVTHVLEGSVRRAGDDLRVTAQLIAASDNSHVWSRTYQRKLGDLFTIQDEIAASVASALHSTLQLTAARTPSPKFAAYDVNKQGEFVYFRRAPGDIDRSVELFEEAVKLDPAYARAWANLAGAYSLQAWSVDPPSDALRAKQGDAAIRAVELDPELAVAHGRLAQYYWKSNESGKARQHFERAFALDPGDSLVLGMMANLAVDSGDFETAIAHQHESILHDPLSSGRRQNLGVMLIAAGRLDEALSAFRTLMEINPDAGPESEVEIPRILALLGRHAEAQAAALRLPRGRFRDHALALLHPSADYRAEADAALERLESYVPAPEVNLPEFTIMDSVRLAEAYASRGMTDQAFGTLQRKLASLARHPEAMIYTRQLRHESRLAPYLEPLHADPRWKAFLGEDK